MRLVYGINYHLPTDPTSNSFRGNGLVGCGRHIALRATTKRGSSAARLRRLSRRLSRRGLKVAVCILSLQGCRILATFARRLKRRLDLRPASDARDTKTAFAAHEKARCAGFTKATENAYARRLSM